MFSHLNIKNTKIFIPVPTSCGRRKARYDEPLNVASECIKTVANSNSSQKLQLILMTK